MGFQIADGSKSGVEGNIVQNLAIAGLFYVAVITLVVFDTCTFRTVSFPGGHR